LEEWDHLAWGGSGGQGARQQDLLRDLQECGYTHRGAQNALMWTSDFGASEAVLAGGIDDIRPGLVAEEVAGRAMAVLRRHGRVTESTPADGVEHGLSPAIERARDALADAYWTTTPSATKGVAERYAYGALDQCQQAGIRQGWSERQVVEALRKQRDTVLASSRTRKAPSLETPPVRHEAASPSLAEWDSVTWGVER